MSNQEECQKIYKCTYRLITKTIQFKINNSANF